MNTQELAGLFSREALLRTLKEAQPLQTTVMDTVFTNRPKHPFPLLRADEYTDILQTAPLVRRGGMPVQVKSGTGSRAIYEPFSLNPMDQVTGAELNDMKLLDNTSLKAWQAAKTDKLRRVIRTSTEGMCAAALSGTLTWPTAIEGGYEEYQVDFGTPLSHTAAKKLSTQGAGIVDLLNILRGLKQKLAGRGYGSKTVIWAGSTVFSKIMAIALNFTSDAEIKVQVHAQVVEGGINVGGYLIREMAETYTPPGGTATPKVAADKLVMVALDAGHSLPYCAIDDLDGNLQALPFFIKPVKTDIPSGYSLVAESKPFPLVNVNGIATCTAV